MGDFLEKKETESVPYSAYESQQIRHERTVKRLIVTIIVMAVVCAVSIGVTATSIYFNYKNNKEWLEAWQSYDYESEETEKTVTYSQDGEGVNNINTGTQGDVNGAESSN